MPDTSLDMQLIMQRAAGKDASAPPTMGAGDSNLDMIMNRAGGDYAPAPQAMAPAQPQADPNAFVAREELGYMPESVYDFTQAATHHLSGGVLGLGQMGVEAFGSQEQANRFRQMLSEREAAYQQRVPTNAMSTAGAALGMAADPTAAVPAARAYGMAAKASPLVRGAFSGAAGMATAPVTEDGNYLTQKGKQAITGAVAGAALGPLGERLAQPRTEARLADRATNMMQGTPNMPTGKQAEAAVKNKLIEQMRGGSKPDTEVTSRLSDFARTGVDPTTGQLTRDPAQYAFERNIAKTEAGIPIAERLSQQGQQLRKNVEELGAKGAKNPYTAGLDAIEKLRAVDAPKQQAVTDAYNVVRESDGAFSLLDDDAFISKAIGNLQKNVADIRVAEKVLPSEVRGYMAGIQKGEIPLDIRTMEQFDKLLSRAKFAANRSGDSNKANAIQQVRDALDETPLYRKAGQESKDAYDYAKGIARERFKIIEANPALKAALDGTDPDKFVNKYIVNGTTEQMKALRELTADDAGFGDLVRSQMAEHLRFKAFGDDLAGDRAFSQASYNKALKALGDEKLGSFFTPDEVADMNAWGRTMAYIQAVPEGSSINYSGTAAQVVNFLKNLSVVGKGIEMAAKPIVTKGKIQKALKAELPKGNK